MRLLHIDSAITGDLSVSRQLSARTVAAWVAAHPETTVEYLDLAQQPVPHLSADALGFRTGQQASTEIQRTENALSEKLVSQFLAADVIVVAAPMYNFTVPTQLKAWIDRIAQTGRTFKYTDKGPVGLAGDKTVFIVSTRGGIYSAGALQAMDHQETFLRSVFGFFGISDLRFVRGEGVGLGDAAKAKALADAEAEIRRQVALAGAQGVKQAA